MIKVGLVGGTGYTGSELLRLLALHPQVEICAVSSRNDEGTPVSSLFPALRKQVNLSFSQPTLKNLQHCDVVFFATPHGVCMQQARELIQANIRVIDLGADFRLKNLDEFQAWYKIPHTEPELNNQAVYGLVEAHREHLKKARLIGLPGCYPTAVQLALFPLLSSKTPLVDESFIIANCASGVSGAGRTASVPSLFSEAAENFKAYATSGHRHLPEIEQGLQTLSGRPCHVTFIPHLVPMVRGILATIVLRLTQAGKQYNFQSLYENHYANEFFVDVMPFGSQPETKFVRGSNFAKIAIHQPQNKDSLVILCVIDNLVKGAAGQAVQALNVCYDLPENLGLTQLPLCP